MKKLLVLMAMMAVAGRSFAGGFDFPQVSPFGNPETPSSPATPADPSSAVDTSKDTSKSSVSSHSEESTHPVATSGSSDVSVKTDSSKEESPAHEASSTSSVSSEPSKKPASPENEKVENNVTTSSSSTDFNTSSRSTSQKSGTTTSNVTQGNEDKVISSEVDTFAESMGNSGNWLKKRVWWEQTEDVYEKIKQVFNEIMGARMEFVSQRNKIDRELDVFFGQMGLEEGPLQDMLDYGLDVLKKEEKEQGYLSKEEEAFATTLKGKERDLEQIKLDVKAMLSLDQKVDEALDTLFKQIDVANQYEQKAWDNFKEIARELDDTIARKLFYETKGLLENIEGIHSYITGTYSGYFHQVVESVQTHSKNISSQINALKQNGVDLKKRAQEMEQARLNPHKVETPVKKEVTKPKVEAQEGFFHSVLHTVKTTFMSVTDWVLKKLSVGIDHVQKWFFKEEEAIKVTGKAALEKAKIAEEAAMKKVHAVEKDVKDFVMEDLSHLKDAVQHEGDHLRGYFDTTGEHASGASGHEGSEDHLHEQISDHDGHGFDFSAFEDTHHDVHPAAANQPIEEKHEAVAQPVSVIPGGSK